MCCTYFRIMMKDFKNPHSHLTASKWRLSKSVILHSFSESEMALKIRLFPRLRATLSIIAEEEKKDSAWSIPVGWIVSQYKI